MARSGGHMFDIYDYPGIFCFINFIDILHQYFTCLQAVYLADV